ALLAATGGLLRRLPRIRSGGPRWRLRLVKGQRDPGWALEHREPAHAGTLLLRHRDGAPRRGNLAQRVLDVLGQDVVEDPRGQVLRLLQSAARSEEHTSELQSRRDLVCRLLLEKKKIRTSPAPVSTIPHP